MDEIQSLTSYLHLLSANRLTWMDKNDAVDEKKDKKTLDKKATKQSKGVSSKVESKENKKDNKMKQPKLIPFDRSKPVDSSRIDYGWSAKSIGRGPHKEEKFYVTTAINYTNGPPHIGHAYEAITTDVIARYHRMKGRKVFFLTGTDEHGQKIGNSAEKIGLKPIEICNKYADTFQALNQRLKISNDFYIRTTMEHHYATSQKLWKMCADNGDIYLGKYEGWYNVKEETFVSEKDAKASDYKDPSTGNPLQLMSEPSYFFRMSKYQDALINVIKNDPYFVLQESYRNSLLRRLEEPLEDLSVSRTTFSWGIPMPEGFDSNHVMYVWFDALTNYLSGIHALDKSELSSFWPANVHIIGKDIIWFHCVIWPCILMSAGLPLPRSVFCHGFVNDKDGKKMSKSIGNVVDPHDVLDRYGVDVFRWYICREGVYGSEICFSVESMELMCNAELADTLGNLVLRASNLCVKYCDGEVPVADTTFEHQKPFDLHALMKKVEEAFKSYAIETAAFVTMEAVRETNKFLTEAEPWKMKDKPNERAQIVRVTLDAVYVVAHFLAPFIPTSASAVFSSFNTKPVAIDELRDDFCNLSPGTTIIVGDILFEKIDSKSTPGAKEEKKGGKTKTGSEKKGKGGAGGGQKKETDPGPVTFSAIDLRVGKIVKAWHHPEADRLFCEEIDVGEDAPRQIVSGLREHYTIETFQGQDVIVVCNLKPRKMMNFMSHGMVLAAKAEDGGVELVNAPPGSKPGERVTIEGESGAPFSVEQVEFIFRLLPHQTGTLGMRGFEALIYLREQVKKKKVWETLVPDLKTDESCSATYKGKPLLVAGGVCRSKSIKNAQIG